MIVFLDYAAFAQAVRSWGLPPAGFAGTLTERGGLRGPSGERALAATPLAIRKDAGAPRSASVRSMVGVARVDDDIYTIPPYDELPPDACHWPGCANPVCERNENGTCPLAEEVIVACSRCGAAVAASTLACPVCDRKDTAA